MAEYDWYYTQAVQETHNYYGTTNLLASVASYGSSDAKNGVTPLAFVPSPYVADPSATITNFGVLPLDNNPTETPNATGVIYLPQDFEPTFEPTYSLNLVPPLGSLQEHQHPNHHILATYDDSMGGYQIPYPQVSPQFSHFEANSVSSSSGAQSPRAEQIQRARFRNPSENKLRRCSLCRKSFPSNRDLNRHLWSTHPIYAAQYDVPSQQASCNVPGCTYVGRRDNVLRHARLKHSITGQE
ncbi:hypothetical protein HD806DRAFT_521300 [Xylariaceae sp. AK1471]|nr:hypothetical protein HD806DRAFT_521300 [Xylariaceae sp. AK1471]